MPGPFVFKDSGCFTGPLSLTGNYDYDSSALELVWATDIPTDTSFSLTDVASVLFANQTNYLGHYLFYNNTSILNLGHSTGNIPIVINQVDTQINNGAVIINGALTASGGSVLTGAISINGTGAITGLNISGCSGKKDFDIPHPTKEGWRLRHVCVEGPTADVYIRGKLENSNVIELPEYWNGLVDLENLTVNLTPIGVYQELFVEKIEWGRKLIVKNNSGGMIKCHYTIYGERIDCEKNIPEYEGTYEDYPGDNSQYTNSAIVLKKRGN